MHLLTLITIAALAGPQSAATHTQPAETPAWTCASGAAPSVTGKAVMLSAVRFGLRTQHGQLIHEPEVYGEVFPMKAEDLKTLAPLVDGQDPATRVMLLRTESENGEVYWKLAPPDHKNVCAELPLLLAIYPR